MSSSGLILFVVAVVALVVADEEPIPQGGDPHHLSSNPHHHVTTVCIQVHGNPMCGPMVKSDAAQLEAVRASQFQAVQGTGLMREAMAVGTPNDAVLQGYLENVPVYRMRSAEEKGLQHQQQPQKYQQTQFLQSNQPPCPEPAARSTGSVTVVQPNPYGFHGLGGGLGGVGIVNPINPINPIGGSSVVVQQQPLGLYRSAEPAPAARTIPFAPFGVNPQQQQQQMRASQFARSQQFNAMRAAANADCDDQPQQMRGSSFQGQQQMRAAGLRPQPQSFASMRESEQSAEFLAKQCAEQERLLKQKNGEIAELKKQIDNLSSMTEKTTIEQKTVSVKSSSDVQKQITEDAKSTDPQLVKKKK